jgi:4-aminobutyrate aminotransferase-like enzyme/Ser/Thr protein kinase RdoA (MazF antagonist)/murein DD-endopeptidase MepM/ murein hydrolase activator NlpD
MTRRAASRPRVPTPTLAMSGVPSLSLPDASELTGRLFGVTGRATALPSDRDQNFLLEADTGERYVLKLANAHETPAMLEAEGAVMQHLAPLGLCPLPVPTRDGRRMASHGAHLVRLITAVPGETLGTVCHRSEALRRDVGRALGRLGRALAAFDHPAVHRELVWDLAGADRVVRERRALVADHELGGHLDACLVQYDALVAPVRSTLPMRVIHGDANDYNVLVDAAAQVVTGVIDFGDMVFSHRVNDVAIAAAYVALGADDPLAAVAAVVAGYHAEDPLSEAEVSVLWPLIGMRLCVSVCMAAEQQAARPDVSYLGISQQAIRRALPRLRRVHPRFAHYTLREVCGLPPVPHAPLVEQWLRDHAHTFAPLLGTDLRTTPVAPLDFSAGSALISSVPEENAPAALDARVRRVLAEHGATIGVGGYDEARLIYHWPNEPVAEEPRTIHVGLDLSLAAGAPLYAPLDGVVHGFENATGYHDYGPLIVLRHETTHEPPVPFYTFYGHLSLDSLDRLTVGQQIRRGEPFARIGSAPTNGHWWEHVHVQLITDLLDVPCNVDGAVRASQRRVWHSVFPDPNLLLGIPTSRFAVHRRAPAIAASRAASVGRNVRLSYGSQPVTVVRGFGAHLYDEAGHRFVDAYNNVAHVGHAHPRVVRAVADQLGLLNTNTRYLQEQLAEYSEALLAQFPDPLSVCFFTASGSEANELALRLAREATGARDLIVMDAAYHGHTTTMIDISPYKHAGPGGRGAPEWVHVSPIPDVYRTRDVEGAPGAWFAARVGEVIDRVSASGRALCGYIAESCPSVGGQILLPDGFLAEVYAMVRAQGGVCIADEVQTGFGRLGTHAFGFQAHGVVPDIVVLGKPIANGYPLGAVITTRAIADAFDNGMEYFSTFGGSTAACVAGLATLQVTLEEQLQARALAIGTELLAGLRTVQASCDLVGDVRGSGLFLGVELVADRETRVPAAAAASFVVQRMRERGVLVGTDGPHHNVLKIRGPMVLSSDDAARVVDTMARALSEVPRAVR